MHWRVTNIGHYNKSRQIYVVSPENIFIFLKSNGSPAGYESLVFYEVRRLLPCARECAILLRPEPVYSNLQPKPISSTYILIPMIAYELIPTCWSTWRHKPQDRHKHIHSSDSHKSHIHFNNILICTRTYSKGYVRFRSDEWCMSSCSCVLHLPPSHPPWHDQLIIFLSSISKQKEGDYLLYFDI